MHNSGTTDNVEINTFVTLFCAEIREKLLRIVDSDGDILSSKEVDGGTAEFLSSLD